MGQDDVVNIQIEFEASTDKLTDKVEASVNSIKSQLDTLKTKIEESMSTADRKDVMRDTVNRIGSMVQKMQMLLLTTKDTTAEASRLNSIVAQMGRVMKGQKVKGFEGTTPEKFAEAKEQAKETKQEVRDLNKELAETANKYIRDILSQFGKLEIMLGKVGDRTKRRLSAEGKPDSDYFSGVRASKAYGFGKQTEEQMRKNIALMERFGEVAGETFDPSDIDTYIDRLREYERISKEIEKFYKSNRQEKWGPEVVELRTELINEQVDKIEEQIAAEGKIAHTEENLNTIISVNTELMKERNAYEVERLKLVQEIKTAEANMRSTGQSLPDDEISALKETERMLKNQVQAYDAKIKSNKIIQQEIQNTLKAEQEVTQEKEKQVDEEKRLKEETQKAIQAEQENIKQAKALTSQYYYRLRSMKMVNRYLDMARNGINGFGKKALTVFSKAGKSVTNLTKKFKLFNVSIGKANKEMNKHATVVKKTSKAHDDWGKSMKRGLTTLLKYTLGIRSLYVLFNRLRGAVGDGMEVMATQYGSVNTTMSSIVTSLNQMKNALTTAIQPLTLILAPILEHFANTLSNVTVKIASFFAAFTGQKVIYKAIRVNKDYIESLKKQKKAMQDLNKEELAHYDMLNVIDQEKEKDSDEDISDIIGFEEIPIEANNAIVDFVNKLKDIIKQLLQPIIDAWNKWKDEIIKALKKLWDSIKKFVKHLIDAILKVWNESKTREIFEKLFESLRNLIEFIQIIIDKIDEAFMHLQNGERIIRAIRDIIWIIAELIRRCTAYAVEWAKSLNLIPLFNAMRELLEEHVVPAMEKLSELAFALFQGAMEIVKYLLERFGPQILDIAKIVWDIVGNIALKLQQVLTDGDDIFDESDRLYRILQTIEGIIDDILWAIKVCAYHTRLWSEEIDFLPLFATLEEVLETKIRPAIDRILGLLAYIYVKVVLPMMTWLIEEALPTVGRILGNIAMAIGNIAYNIRTALEENDNLERIVGSLQTILNKVLELIERCAIETEEWAKHVDFVPLFDSFRQLLEDIQPMIDAILQIALSLYRDVILPFMEYMIEEGLPKLNQKLGEIVQKVDWDHLTSKVQEFLAAFEPFIEKVWEAFVIILGDLGDAIAKFVNSEAFDHLVDILIKWMNDADPEDMAKGVERLVKCFLELQAAINFVSVLGHFREFVMTLINWHNNRAMVKTIQESTKAIRELKGAADVAGEGATGLLPKLKGLITTSEGTATALGKISGVVSLVAGAFLNLKGFTGQLSDGFNILDAVVEAAGAGLAAFGAVVLGLATGPVAAAIAACVVAVEQFIVAVHDRMVEFGESIPKAIVGVFDNLIHMLDGIFDKLGYWIGYIFGWIARKIVDFITTLPDKIIPFFENVGQKIIDAIQNEIQRLIDNYQGHWWDLGKDIILGILHFFYFPIELISSAIASLVNGFINGLKDGFDTHSPSKLPQIVEIGLNIIQGILSGMVNAILEFPMWALNNIVIPIRDAIVDAAKTIWGDLNESGAEFIRQLKEGAESKYDEFKESVASLWSMVRENAKAWWLKISGDLSTWWSTISSDASTKFEEIRSNIETKWSEVKENVKIWWSDISQNLTTWWYGIIEDARNKFEEVRRNIEDKWTEVKVNVETKWAEIKGRLDDWWNSIVNDARNKFEELRGAIEDKWNNVRENAERKWDEIKEAIRNKINGMWDLVDRMRDFGRDVIDGFKNGVEGAIGGAGDAIRNFCSNIAGDVRDFFDIHSPSKLFAYYGKMLTEGIVVGMTDDTDEVADAMEEIVPGLDAFDRLYDTIISKLSSLRQDAISLTDSLVDSMIDSFSRLDNLDVLSGLSSQLSRLETMKIPDIVTGKSISPQMEMSINVDTSKLENLLTEVIDKLDNISVEGGSSNSAPIVLQLDRTELARAVWDEQEKRYKQLGYRPVYS